MLKTWKKRRIRSDILKCSRETRLPMWVGTLWYLQLLVAIYPFLLNDCSRIHTISGNAKMELQVAKTSLLLELATWEQVRASHTAYLGRIENYGGNLSAQSIAPSRAGW